MSEAVSQEIPDLKLFRKKPKAEFIMPNRAKEILQANPNASIDDILV